MRGQPAKPGWTVRPVTQHYRHLVRPPRRGRAEAAAGLALQPRRRLHRQELFTLERPVRGDREDAQGGLPEVRHAGARRPPGLVGVTLAAGVITWAFSPIKFQADMGILLTFMFLWNMVGALVLIPALSHFLLRKVE